MTVILADLGGTHLRLAFQDDPDHPVFYRIADFAALEDVVAQFLKEKDKIATALYMAATGYMRGDVARYTRKDRKTTHWNFDPMSLRQALGMDIHLYHDLEAATHALPALAQKDLTPLHVPAAINQGWTKALISAGTGMGHSLLNIANHGEDVIRSHGGHFPPAAVTEEQRQILKMLEKFPLDRTPIFEDVCSGTGLKNLFKIFHRMHPDEVITDPSVILNDENTVRLFHEFLGIYANLLANICGAYSGIYLTGGVVDELMEKNLWRQDVFNACFHLPMVESITALQNGTPVYYINRRNLPLLGLARLAQSGAA